MKLCVSSATLLLLSLCCRLSVAQFDRVPAMAPFSAETRVAQALPMEFQPSGCAYHPRLRELFVANDQSTFARIADDGTLITTYDLEITEPDGTKKRFDTEGMVILNPEGNTLWLINEFPAQVIEYDFVQKVKTRVFALNHDDFVPPLNATYGIEGITFLPDITHPEGGLFMVAHSLTGDVYKFQIPKQAAGSAVLVGKFSTWPGHGAHGLDYRKSSGLLYVLFGNDKRIRPYRVDVSSIAATDLGLDYAVPGAKQSGFCLNPEETSANAEQALCVADAYVCEDYNNAEGTVNAVYRYAFEHTCPDLYFLKGGVAPPTPVMDVTPMPTQPAASTCDSPPCPGEKCGEENGKPIYIDRCQQCGGQSECLSGGVRSAPLCIASLLSIITYFALL